MLHVLHGEKEFQDAVFRAAQLERGAAEVLWARADHYEGLIAPASITDIRANRRLPSDSGSVGISTGFGLTAHGVIEHGNRTSVGHDRKAAFDT